MQGNNRVGVSALHVNRNRRYRCLGPSFVLRSIDLRYDLIKMWTKVPLLNTCHFSLIASGGKSMARELRLRPPSVDFAEVATYLTDINRSRGMVRAGRATWI